MAITEGRIILINVRNVSKNLGIQVCLEYWVENLQAMWSTITRHPTSQPSTAGWWDQALTKNEGSQSPGSQKWLMEWLVGLYLREWT
jgi:hypothetical protein